MNRSSSKLIAAAIAASLLTATPSLAAGPYPVLATAAGAACFKVELCLDNPYTPGTCTNTAWYGMATPASGTYNSLYNATFALAETALATAQPIYMTYTVAAICGVPNTISYITNGTIY